MPNVNITIYLNEKTYFKYLKNKEKYNKRARDYFKEDLIK